MRNKKLVMMVMSFFVIVLIFGIWVERKVIFQEGNPTPIALAILKLHLTRSDIATVSSNPEVYVLRAKEGYRPFISLMEKQGWTYVEQLGSGLVFEKDEEREISSSRMFTRYYRIIRR